MQASTTSAVDSALDTLASTMAGELVRPGDEAYDEARSVWNGMIDVRPVAIARCASTDDVRGALRVARPYAGAGTTSPASARSTVA